MKEIYTSAEMEIIQFDAEDVITTSGGGFVCPNETPFTPAS